MFPNLDMLAFMPDGSLKVYHSWEKTAQEFIDEGVQTVYSFGPYLLLDGKVSERAYANNENKNPRCAIGMVEPGHYVAIMCEGRLKRSAGVTISYLAKMMRAKGCQVAFNMDGGADGSDGLHGQAAQPDWRLRRRQNQLPPDKRSAGLRHIRAGRNVRSAINIRYRGRRTRFCPVFSEKIVKLRLSPLT